MGAFRSDLLHHLLAPRMTVEFDSICRLLRKNFDIVVRLSDDEGREVFSRIARERACDPMFPFEVVSSFDDAFRHIVGDNRKSVLCLSQEPLPKGSGFVERHVLPAGSFLPPLSTVVMEILKHLRLDVHMDVFDGRRMRHMKDVLREFGLSGLVDAVVQVVYLAGVEANDAAAECYLASVLPKVEPPQKTVQQPACLAQSAHAQKFFHDLLSGDKDPHSFFKASLSYYVVHGMGHSVLSASRLLKISRNTVADHLALAEQSGVEQYLGLSTVLPRRRTFVG
jgi:hypothetical protein